MKKPVKKSPVKATTWVEWRLFSIPHNEPISESYSTKKNAVRELRLYYDEFACDFRIIKTRVTVIE
jgi:hypothetical protein